MKCDLCGIEVKNLGVHKYHKHRELMSPGVIVPLDDLNDVKPNVIVDEHIPDKQLSSLLSELKNLLRQYAYSLDVKTWETSGYVTDVEINARIQVRR